MDALTCHTALCIGNSMAYPSVAPQSFPADRKDWKGLPDVLEMKKKTFHATALCIWIGQIVIFCNGTTASLHSLYVM